MALVTTKRQPGKANSLLVLALEAMRENTERVPEGWLTVEDWCAKERKSESTIRRALRVLIRAGKAEQRAFKVKAGSRVLPVPHYRLK